MRLEFRLSIEQRLRRRCQQFLRLLRGEPVGFSDRRKRNINKIFVDRPLFFRVYFASISNSEVA